MFLREPRWPCRSGRATSVSPMRLVTVVERADRSRIAKASIPSGRFAQYRAILRTDDPTKSPELRSIALRYQTENLAPEITKLDVPDITAADGSTKPAKLAIKWDASDPNGDDLEFTLHVKKDGWPDWIKLGDAPITESKFEWDSMAVPAGLIESSSPPEIAGPIVLKRR